MKETSWRTLMLLSTLLAVFVIFQETARSPKPRAARARPALAVHPLPDPDKAQDKPTHGQPEPVMTGADARPVGFDDTRADWSQTGWSSSPVPESPQETGWSLPALAENLNETDESAPPVKDDPNEPLPAVPE